MRERATQDISGNNAAPERKRASTGRAIRWAALLIVTGGISLVAGFETARKTIATPNWESGLATQESSRAVSLLRMPDSEKSGDGELKRLPLQQQAERLLERAMREDESSLNLLRENVDSWCGRIRNTDRLFDLVLAALNSKDLRVRTVAVDLDLAANNLRKSPASIDHIMRQLKGDPQGRGLALWRLGSLGNRGVEPERVLHSLLNYAHAPNEHTRYWAVEGLAMLGNDATIGPLLERLTRDTSPRVRARAASSLGQSGLLTREERLAAVPHLLNFADDDSLNTTTRELVYGTLRVITGAALGNDANAWRAWWAHHDPAQERHRQRTGVIRT